MGPWECAPLVPAEELMFVYTGHLFLLNVPGKAQVHAQGVPHSHGNEVDVLSLSLFLTFQLFSGSYKLSENTLGKVICLRIFPNSGHTIV